MTNLLASPMPAWRVLAKSVSTCNMPLRMPEIPPTGRRDIILATTCTYPPSHEQS